MTRLHGLWGRLSKVIKDVDRNSAWKDITIDIPKVSKVYDKEIKKAAKERAKDNKLIFK